uniref:Cell division cycle-associated 7-like protein n=2 Tax=Lygus hesperus TaxID=30085 RepID=A0A0A9XZZ0_LYGHE
MNTDTDTITLRKCRKKFCFACLERLYGITLQGIPNINSWRCPACIGLCNCASCKRQYLQTHLKNRLRRHQSVTQSTYAAYTPTRISRSKSKANLNNHLVPLQHQQQQQ